MLEFDRASIYSGQADLKALPLSRRGSFPSSEPLMQAGFSLRLHTRGGLLHPYAYARAYAYAYVYAFAYAFAYSSRVEAER